HKPVAPAPSKPKPKPAEAKPKAVDPDDVEQLYHQARYSDVLALCAVNSSVAAQSATACVLAACHMKDPVHARLWLKSSGKRSPLAAACSAMDVNVDPPKPKDCEADP